MHFIPLDWSGIFEILLACTHFPHPHTLHNIRDKVMEILKTKFSLNQEKVIDILHNLTYDGAACNSAFNPRCNVGNITNEERRIRREVQETFKTVEESFCGCHRLSLVLKAVFNDEDSEVSVALKSDVDTIYSLGDKVNHSGPNRQELARVQIADTNRRNKRVLQDLKPAKIRWGTQEARIGRLLMLLPYYKKMCVDSWTRQEKTEWNLKLAQSDETTIRLNYVHTIMVRISIWLAIFQGRHITISLLVVCAKDLIEFANKTAIEADMDVNEEAEKYCSKFQAQFEEEFSNDFDSDYLKLCTLLDSRVNYVLKASKSEVD
jgi:hypothetical protein